MAQAELRATTVNAVGTFGSELPSVYLDQTNVGTHRDREDREIKSRAPIPSTRHKPHRSPLSTPFHQGVTRYPTSIKANTGLKIISWRLGPAPRFYSADQRSPEYRHAEEQRTNNRPPVPQYPPNPFTPLQKGNSDPFSAASIEITPKVNELLLWQGVYLETVWPREAPAPLTLWKNEGQQIISSKIRFYALLAWVTNLLRAAVTDKETSLALDIQSLR